MSPKENFEAIIGLEVHAQLKTSSKMFCGCSTNFGDPPNTNVCPVCTGQPGTLPVMNGDAVDMAIRTGLALNGTIQTKSVFARKNYFYPDLPKGYQISQHSLPLCLGGHIGNVSIIRLHLEEDAGKLLHDFGGEDKSHIDFNRCGIPLVEIVSSPDIRTPEEAGEYLRTLRNILVYLDVCEGNMQEGNFRCDANISVRPVGQTKFGTRTELKNLNSFKAVEKAIAYEIDRQSEIIRSGGEVVQETLLWREATGHTEAMRSKEEAHDYRYFPDPDLLPLIVDDEWIEGCREKLPELATERAKRFVKQYGLPEYDAHVLVDEKALADFYEECVKEYGSPKKISNWIMTELMHELKGDERSMKDCPITPKNLATLVKMIDEGTISGKIGKNVFQEMYKTGKDPEGIVKEKGLKQESDEEVLEKVVQKVIDAHPDEVKAYKEGKTKLIGFFVGEVMKETRGQANPKIVNEIIKRKLK
jgi:aspartyl-tRNA(Asn)/glutamyl-tRNA(Gln) amidotransferase subunit B